MNLLARVCALVCLSALAGSSALAQTKTAPAPASAQTPAPSAEGCDKPVFQPRNLDPLVRYKPSQLFERHTEGKLLPCAKDFLVAPDAQGYAGSWQGSPWYEPLLWCSTMLRVQTRKQSLPRDSPESVLAQHLYEDALTLYDADRGKSGTDTVFQSAAESLFLSVSMSREQERVLVPDRLLCAGLEKSYIAALSARKTTKQTPPQAFEQFNKDRFPPDARDLLVPQRATGFATQWVGQPWFKLMVWCAVEVDAAGKTMDEQLLAATFMSDALKRFQADRGTSAENVKALKDARSRLGIMFVVPGLLDDQVGHRPSVQTCNGIHQNYVALASTTPATPPTSRTASSSLSSIPYSGTGGPLPADAKDLRMVTPPNTSVARWASHPWQEPLVWCTALNLVKYEAHPSVELKQAAIQSLTLAGMRVAKDRGVTLEQIGTTVREQATFIGKQMQADNLLSKPQFADFDRGCTDIVTAYEREAAAK